MVLTGVVLLIGTYVFIPDQIIVSEVEQVESSERILEKYLSKPEYRREWWPATYDEKNFSYDRLQFSFEPGALNSQPVIISARGFRSHSLISWKLSSKNIFLLGWKTSIVASKNPVTRILQYQHARKIKQSMIGIMESLLTFVVDSKNVYGISVERKTVKDTILATTSMISASRPRTSDLYQKISHIENFIKKQAVSQVNSPMINISQDPKGQYQTMIAVPINKDIVPDGDISLQKMIAGNILVAEIKGGPQMVETGFTEMKAYMKDFKLTSPAMPFELLVTNRIAEPDTSKWVTKIFYPIL